MSEKSAYRELRKHILRPGDRIDRIENLVGTGFPDVNMCLYGTELWVEIKTPREPKRATTPLFGSNHKLSLDQRNWFLAQRRAGGRGFIYIKTASCRLLLPSHAAETVNEHTLTALKSQAWWSSAKRSSISDWDKLRVVLIGHEP